MNARVVIAFFSVGVLSASAFLLVTASPLLSRGVPGIESMPMGTLIAWLGIVALPLGIYSALGGLHPPRRAVDRATSAIMKALLTLAVAWVPISYGLSGNLAFTFERNAGFRGSENALFCFFYGTIGLVLAPLVVMLLYGAASWLSRGKDARP
ncbi:hypothetical protein [Wenzhouxiangella sediminis]|uniref:Uncharacterized protein n=1 Tax=Wenzhouxiangella sediminis TaxID=1792836 RepID=A0A3E1K6C8_9GAMM|nr:hypothetical protein [Wenzhouxiangella sediminis]RFF29510.1 hypothetical protein DZC52_12780 [Wenzhouxiangella sediminis]